LKLTGNIIHFFCTVFPVASQWLCLAKSATCVPHNPACNEVLPVCRPDPPRVAARHCDVRCLQVMAACARAGQPRCPPRASAGSLVGVSSAGSAVASTAVGSIVPSIALICPLTCAAGCQRLVGICVLAPVLMASNRMIALAIRQSGGRQRKRPHILKCELTY